MELLERSSSLGLRSCQTTRPCSSSSSHMNYCNYSNNSNYSTTRLLNYSTKYKSRVKTIPKFVDGSGPYFHDRQTSVPFEAIRFSASPVRALKSTILAEWPIESQQFDANRLTPFELELPNFWHGSII